MTKLIFTVAFRSVIRAEICDEITAREQMVEWFGFIRNGV